MLKTSNQQTYNSLEALDEVWWLLDDESNCRNNEGDNLDEVINFQEADILDDEAEVGELEGEVNEEIVPSSRYNRKQLTKSRIVNSIDNAVMSTIIPRGNLLKIQRHYKVEQVRKPSVLPTKYLLEKAELRLEMLLRCR